VNVSTNVHAKFRCAPLRIKKGLGIFRELITTRIRTTSVFWDPPLPGPKCAVLRPTSRLPIEGEIATNNGIHYLQYYMSGIVPSRSSTITRDTITVYVDDCSIQRVNGVKLFKDRTHSRVRSYYGHAKRGLLVFRITLRYVYL